MWHIEQSNFRFALRFSSSIFNPPPSATVAVTWHITQAPIDTRLFSGETVSIVSTVWHVEHSMAAWTANPCLNLPEAIRLFVIKRISRSNPGTFAGKRGSRSARDIFSLGL